MHEPHSGGSSSPAPNPPSKAPSPANQSPNAQEQIEPDLTHVPKKRRQAVGRPHPWIIAAHKSALGSRSVSGSPETCLPLAVHSPRNGSGQASLDSSPSIGRPSWPWDPEQSDHQLIGGQADKLWAQGSKPLEASSGERPSKPEIRDGQPKSAAQLEKGLNVIGQQVSQLGANGIGHCSSADFLMGNEEDDGDSAAKGIASLHSQRTQDEDDEDVAVSALWALSANATAENSPESPDSLQPDSQQGTSPDQPGTFQGHGCLALAQTLKHGGARLDVVSQRLLPASGQDTPRHADGVHRVRTKNVVPQAMMKIAAEAQARQWLSAATLGSKPASGHGSSTIQDEESTLATQSSKGFATGTSSPHAPNQLPCLMGTKLSVGLQAAPSISAQSPHHRLEPHGLQDRHGSEEQQPSEQAQTWSGSSMTRSGPAGKLLTSGQENKMVPGMRPEAGHVQELQPGFQTRAGKGGAPFSNLLPSPSGKAAHLQIGKPTEHLQAAKGSNAVSPGDGDLIDASEHRKLPDIMDYANTLQAGRMTTHLSAKQPDGLAEQLLSASSDPLMGIQRPTLAAENNSKCSSQDNLQGSAS